MPQELDDARQDGDKDDSQDDQGEVLLHEGQIPEEVSGEHADQDPGQSAYHVVSDETAVTHGADPGYEWSESANDGHEPGDDDGFSTVLLIELVSAPEVLRVEKTGFLVLEYLGPQVVSNPVIHGVSRDGGDRKQDKK